MNRVRQNQLVNLIQDVRLSKETHKVHDYLGRDANGVLPLIGDPRSQPGGQHGA